MSFPFDTLGKGEKDAMETMGTVMGSASMAPLYCSRDGHSFVESSLGRGTGVSHRVYLFCQKCGELRALDELPEGKEIKNG
jgi:hypothetical protein